MFKEKKCSSTIHWPSVDRSLQISKCYYPDLHVCFFLRNTFPKADSMFLKIFSIRAWNAFYKFWFSPSPKNGYLQCAQLYCFFFFKFQVTEPIFLWRWHLLFEYDFVCLFWRKKNLGEIYLAHFCSLKSILKAFIGLI